VVDTIAPAVVLTGSDYDEDFLTPEFHKSRRDALRALLPDNSVAIFFSSSIKNRSNDVDFEFHQDPNFYYLTGYNEPHALLLLFKDPQEISSRVTTEIIFVQPKDSTKELWIGKRLGAEGVKSQLGISRVYTNDQFADFEIDFLDYDMVYYIADPTEIIDDPKKKGDLYSLYRHFQIKIDTNRRNVDTYMLKEKMASLRQIKLDEEMDLLRKAIDITCKAHNELIKSLHVGLYEYEAEAIIEYVFKSEGAEYPGFPSIVGGGENTCILHYTASRKRLRDNELLVVDIGAEYHGYSADVTRTVPVNGKYTEEQKIIYNIVLDAQKAGIAACIPGNKFWDPNVEATKVIIRRLMQIGLIVKREDYQDYFMHGTSHYLGLDVHDVGLYGSLTPGNVLTVEPGIYIPEGSNCDPKWWNIGVRIEDDVLITKSGADVLSDCVPKEIDDIESLVQQESNFK